jgi:PPOX class probable F420-dependent enzyme
MRITGIKEFSMSIPLSNEIKQLLDRANFVHLATLMPDGSPQSVPVWAGRDGDRIIICTGEGSLKAKNTKRDPRVSLSIVDFENPYEEAQLRGRVVERRPDPDLKVMDPISQKYTSKPFPMRSPEGRVALFIEVEKVRYLKLPFVHTPAA